jgi:predicted NUDIX family NTP pyrophosphohydrolase
VPARSAGILLYRHAESLLEVLLVHPGGPFFSGRDAGSWGIPKGEYAPGEEALACALREFEEETGHPVAPVGLIDLGEIRQGSGKIVRAWAIEGELDAGEIRSNTFRLEWPPRSGRMEEFPEVDRAGWFTAAEAAGKMLAAQLPLLERLAGALAAAPGSDPGPPGSHPANAQAEAHGRRSEKTMADEQEEDGSAVGDTEEVHDTIHPGDLPPDHPGRQVAEEKLAEAEERGEGGGIRP